MSQSSPANAHRSGRLLGAIAAVAAVAALTLGPRAIVAPARDAFMRSMDAVPAPLPAWISTADAERLLNTLMFVPLGATIALLLHRRLWPLAILAGFAMSAAVEYAQATIPGRVPDAADVFWNTVGAAIGVVLLTSTRLVHRRLRRIRR